MRKGLLLVTFLALITTIALAQTRKIIGTVTGENGAVIAGASVTIKGTSKGTTTSSTGKFSIDFPTTGKRILVVNSIGYGTQEISITNQTDISIKLVTDTKLLEDVVVVGYGAVKKKDLTGAVGSVKAVEIVRGNPANATQALQGQVPGVLVTKMSNKPGQLWQIAIRGENTITPNPNADGTVNLTYTSSTQQFQGTEPLVVIDGIIGGKLQDINPADIESMDILKDASSTAIYGSRGANGVIIISSKRGLSGKPRVTLDSYFGQRTPAHLPEMENAQEFYKSTITDAQLNGSTITEASAFNVNELAIINSGKTVDLARLVAGPGMNAGSTLSISGGNGATTYRISGGYIQEDGMVPLTYYKKYNMNTAVDSKITRYLKVGFSLYQNYSTNPTGSLEVPRTVYRERPTSTIYYKDLVDAAIGGDAALGAVNGFAVRMGRGSAVNPLLEASSRDNYTWTRNVNSQMGNAYAEINLLEGLVFKSSLSLAYQLAKQDEYRGKYSKAINVTGATRASVENDFLSSYTFDNQLTYNYQKGKSKLNVTALQSAYKNTNEFNVIAVTGLPYVSYWYNLGSTSGTPVIGSGFNQRTLSSYMGRINYTFNEKYLLTFTGRSDGASQLAPGNKWAFFPSGAFAWRLGDEKFFKKIKSISDLKLRVSYGQVGNSVVSPYSTSATLTAASNYSFGQTAGIGFGPNNLANQDLGWERSQELNLGLNIGLFNNRITAVAEVYNRTTKDLIMRQSIPTTNGFSSVISNVGRVSNKGIELLLNTVNIQTKDFQWTSSFNFTKNINKLEELANGAKFGYSGSNTSPESILAVGYPLKSFMYFQANGIWQLKDSALAKTYGAVPGSVRIVDQNKDGKISAGVLGQDDRVILGSQLPNFTLGFTNRVSYKNFDLAVMMYYRNGTMFKNGFMSNYVSDAGGGARLKLNYWTRNNPSNEMWGMGVAKSFSDALYYEDASFLRIADITVGYNLSREKLQKLGVDRLRLYAQIINPAYFTKFKGGDPEYNGAAYQDDFPSLTCNFGLNLSF
jgi:TonB-linked SusC/RagA family outer membrane protein